MSGIIGIILAILAVFILVKVAIFALKVIAVLILIGIAVGAYVVISRRINGGR